LRAILDRGLTSLARLALRGFYRDLQVIGREHLPQDRPTLVVANHFNALLDAVLVMYALRGLPRFVAKAALWRSRGARPLLWLAGMVPVERSQDGGDTNRNRTTFAACARVLAQGGTVGLFPEGGVAPTPALGQVRSGAARIALAARAAGAEGLLIVPIGLVYEDKLALRSRALVRIGVPIDLDRHLTRHLADADHDADPDHDAESHQDRLAVRHLTSEIDHRLRELAPVYRDEIEAGVLGRAADITLRDPHRSPIQEVRLSEREAVARRLSSLPVECTQPVIDRLARYELRRSVIGLRDVEVVSERSTPQAVRLLAVTVLRLLVVAPFALVGAAVNAIPYWAVHWAGRFVQDPALAASARLLAGVALFPSAWLITAWLAPWDTWWARTSVIVVAPALGLLAVGALERSVEMARAWHGWLTRMERHHELDELREERRQLVELIRATIHEAA